MTINFFEPGAAPKPRDQVKIELLDAQVYPDRWRVKININVTPFLERPSVAVALVSNTSPLVVAEMDIIESMHNKMEFTMHIRHVDDPAGSYTLKARLYYEQDIANAYDQHELAVIVPQETTENVE